jgi:hypothetical protein
MLNTTMLGLNAYEKKDNQAGFLRHAKAAANRSNGRPALAEGIAIS